MNTWTVIVKLNTAYRVNTDRNIGEQHSMSLLVLKMCTEVKLRYSHRHNYKYDVVRV